MLVKLGLPDTREWKYVKSDNPGGLEQRVEGWERSGHFWIEPTADADGIRRMTRDGLKVTLMAQYDRRDQEKAREKARLFQSKGLQVEWTDSSSKEKDGDEAADAAGLVEALKAEFAKGERSSVRHLLQDSETLASLFFHAAHWHRRGHEKEAAALIQLILEKLPRKAVLLESAIASIANRRQAEATQRFSSSQDWAAYQKDLEGILADFPKSWPERPLTVRLVEKLKERAAGGTPPVKTDSALPVSPEQVTWWDNYGKPKEKDDEEPIYGGFASDLSGIGQAWVEKMFPATGKKGPALEDNYQIEVARQLGFDLANGWNWMEVMAAGLGDETLVPLQSEYDGYSGRSRWRDLDEEPAELEGEELEEAWRELQRPRTRDEIARSFLKGVVPQPEDSEYDWWEVAEATEIAETVKGWHDKMAGKSGEELVALYFEEGDENWKEQAAAVKVRIGSDEEVAELAEMVLAAPSSGTTLALEIVKRRGKEGRAFFDAYRESLKKEVTKDESDSLTPEQIENQIESYYGHQLRSMEALLSGEDFTKLFSDYLAGRKTQVEFSSAVQALEMRPSTREEIEAAMTGFLELQNPTPERRGFAFNVISYAVSLHLQDAQQAEGQDKDNEEEAKDRPLPDWMAKGFARLIEERGADPVNYNSAERTLSEIVHHMVDGLVNPIAYQKTAQLLSGMPENDVWAIFDARGRARMAGEATPELPTGESVPAERKAGIEKAVSGLETTTPADWDSWVRGLTVAERLVLRDLLEAGESNAARKAMVLRIGSVRGSEDAKWKSFESATLEKSLLDRLFQTVRDEVGEEALEVWVVRLPLLMGFQATVFEKPIKEVFPGSFRDPDEEAPDFDAAAAFECYHGSGGITMLHLRGKGGEWKAHEEKDTPNRLFGLVRGNVLPPVEFAEELATRLEEFNSDDETLFLRFVSSPLPAPDSKDNP